MKCKKASGVSGSITGALIGGLSGAGIGAGVAAFTNQDRDAEIAAGIRRKGDRVSVGGSAAIGGITGALLGGLAGGVIGSSGGHSKVRTEVLRPPSRPVDPFFGPNAAPHKPLVIPPVDKFKDATHVYPENYFKQFYGSVPGGWDAVKHTSTRAGEISPGGKDVARMDKIPKANWSGTVDPSQAGISLWNQDGPRTEATFNFRDEMTGDPEIAGTYPSGPGPFHNYMKGIGADIVNKVNGLDRKVLTRDEAFSNALGHEARHAATMVYGETLPHESMPSSTVYIADQNELTQALGSLKAETAQMTGRLIRDGSDFRELLYNTGTTSSDEGKFIEMQKNFSPEGGRMLNYMRTLWQEDPQRVEEMIDSWDKERLFDQVVKRDIGKALMDGMGVA